MAFIPGHKHDCFISYSNQDIAWVNALHEQLKERMLHRLGCECEIWQEIHKLQAGQLLPIELANAIRGSTAFIAVLSRSYQSSAWCEMELSTFLEESAKAGLETGGHGRVIKAIMFPWVNDAHEGFLSHSQDIKFFDRDPNTGQEREFKPASGSFRRAVDKLSYDIYGLLYAVLRGMKKAFLARPAEDARDDRDMIAREIKAVGYALSPPPVGALPKGLSKDVLKRYIDDASAAVFTLAAEFDHTVRDQIDLALEAEKKLIFCLTRRHKDAIGDQKDLIKQIRENRWGLRPGTWALLENQSLAMLIQELIDLLAPQPRTVPEQGGDQSRLYLLCDQTTPEDAGFAREVQSQISKREKTIRVDLPPLPSDSISPASNHERLLRECDGLLLYHERAPLKWVARSFMDLLKAPELPNRRDLKFRAMLICGDFMPYPGVDVIRRHDPFDLLQLEPYLAPLRTLGYHQERPNA